MTHNKSDEEMKNFYSTEGIPEEMKQALSFMRQWLNEDRKATPMVTAKDLWNWLEEDYITLRKSEAEKRKESEKTGEERMKRAQEETNKYFELRKKEVVEDVVSIIITMADDLEKECGKDGDNGTKQWMAFKRFRNAIGDRFLTNEDNK